MNTTWALIRREARDSRVSLIAAPLVSVVVLSLIHALFQLPFAVSNAAAMAVLILIPVWTLYFGADLFATDCASGRMSTKALLPVSALTLWRAKVLFLAITISGLSAGIVGLELALQRCVGTAESLAHFETQALPLFTAPSSLYVLLVLLLAATSVLCSMLVENALVAMLLSLIAGAGLAGAGWTLMHALALAGIELSWVHWLVLSVAITAILLSVSATAFARGQRKLGLRVVRVKFALATLSAVTAVGGLGTAAIVYRGVMTGLEHPLARFVSATGSPDGRHLALAVETKLSCNVEASHMVWMIDLETGRRDLVTNTGLLISDFYSCEPMPWDSEHSLRVLGMRGLPWMGSYIVQRVEATNDGVVVSPIGGELASVSLLIPSWAEATHSAFASVKARALRIRWKERAIERTFEGDWMSTAIGRGVYLSPTPGRLVVLRDGRVTLLDLATDSERVLFEGGVTSMGPSPDGSALLVYTADATHALSGVDGTSLHEPWARKEAYVQWISGEGATRVVRVVATGKVQSQRIVDLDTHIEFEARLTVGHMFVHHLGDRGYVCEDDSGLVWVDSKGALLKVLVGRIADVSQ